jgi:radical SAM/Cys-rich protein
MRDTRPLLIEDSTFPALRRDGVSCLQVNLGYRCNLSCVHCHVNAGPNRSEMMSADNIESVLRYVRQRRPQQLDLTGGAPEMHPQFRYLVTEARRLGVTVIDRCNLSILLQPGYETLADFLARERVQVVASLPCYLEENVEQQRGKGVYDDSIQALQLLNKLGYSDLPGLSLKLVYNPVEAVLPPSQQSLQEAYKRELGQRYGIRFNELLTITNMPIQRFGAVLLQTGQYQPYMQLLKDSFQAANLSSLMCRSLVSVDWQGFVYDCDFNQMLELPLIAGGRQRLHLSELLTIDLCGNPIATAEHCYACAAGQGSSCGGALNV